MRIIKLLFLFSFLFSSSMVAQDSCNIRISLLTCSPGEELYSTFGHSALRVTHTVSGEDVVFNYGTFNFDEPGFYTKFIRGKLLYYVSTEDFLSFADSYRQQNRSITEQVLNLNCSEKQEAIRFLQNNLRPENRSYKYDFLFDNCTTRLRDLTEENADNQITYPAIVPVNTTFRDLIHVYLDSNNQHWSKLGIDLLLGSRTDAEMNNRQAMFLPDYLMIAYDKASIGNRPLVTNKKILFEAAPLPGSKDFAITPLLVTTAIFIIVMLLSFSRNRKIISSLRNFDSMILFITGLLGLLMLFMWFGTDHIMCADNYNLLWAWPTHVVYAFLLHSKKRWVKNYQLIMIAVNVLVLAAWFFLPQELNYAIMPLLLLITIRAYMRIKPKQNNTSIS